MRAFVGLLFFLVIANDGDSTTIYSQHMATPFAWVDKTLLAPLPIKVRVFDLLMLGILAAASGKGSRRSRAASGVAQPMRNALWLATATVVVWFAYGAVTGGDLRAASWQVYLMLSAVLAAFAVSACFQTVEHYAFFGKVLFAAALYRAAMCWIFHFAYVVTGRVRPAPEYVAAHDDTVTWVVAIIAAIGYALTRRNRTATVRAVAAVLFLIVAIQFNQRRLAWVSLVMGLLVFFFVIPPGRLRRRITRFVWVVAPVVAIYTAAGWGRTEAIFRPLRSFSTVSDDEDKSTKARNCENLGLLATVQASNPLTGTGWGHPYKALTDKYTIAQFMELWPYVPHNSILGLLAYSGILGFIGYWLALPTAVFFTARTARMSASPAARNVGTVASVSAIVCANQLYGDMGIFSMRTMYVLAAIYGIALRLPVTAGVWEVARRKAPARGTVRAGEVQGHA